MALSRAAIVDQAFSERLLSLEPRPLREDLDSPVRDGARLTARQALALFESQASSRHLDLAARELKVDGQSFYTIGSSGHEGNAAVAAALRPSDMAFLHYRSGAFFLQRARQVPGETPLFDVLLGMVASSDEPIAGGRHKVFGSKTLQIPPQTSTIASHLPKAMGAAAMMDRHGRADFSPEIPGDAITVCTFGDASSNHSTATGAINTACWAAHQNLPVPVLFVCEDNGLGISVHTPEGWVESAYGHRDELAYFCGDGLDIVDAYETAVEAVEHVRSTRRPGFLHLKLVRLLGHAGSDVQQSYHKLETIEAAEAQDPVFLTAKLLVEQGWATPQQLVEEYEALRTRIRALGQEAVHRPKIQTAEEVIEPQAPLDPDALRAEVGRTAPAAERAAFWGERLPESDRPRHMAMQLNRALGDLLVKYPESLIFGEDVAKKGGVYHVTAELSSKAGVGRVFNTLLDEQSILGLAIGAGHLGYIPIPEIQYLAYLHNAEDQIRGEAASLQFFSQGQFQNPMVVRIASYAYQKGFGGHFHNDNSVAVLRDIPGLIIASPARADDAVSMLRTCMAAARVNGRVSAFLEPIALYMTKDLHETGDSLWRVPYEETSDHIAIGEGKTWREGDELTLVSWANGLWMSLRVAERLKNEYGISAKVFDLRWLNPLPEAQLVEAARSTGKVLVVDETRATGGVSEGVFAALIDGGFEGRMKRVAAWDSFIPLGEAANRVLVQETDIEKAVLELLGRDS
ncbi:MAG: thiamine pyrophosphate-dependent enzyme [Myxococcota bacterium]|nr:thiamine pyrophosphate-dependent enzyme [Myxococcota bacterium]